MSAARAFNRFGIDPITIPLIVVLLSLFTGCATTSQHSAINSHASIAYDPGPGWRQVEDAPLRYVPADLASGTPLDFRNGGWVDAHGLAFFIPHESKAGESEALIESLIGPPSVGDRIAETSLAAGQALTFVTSGQLLGAASM
jgi:hypothetical protein